MDDEAKAVPPAAGAKSDRVQMVSLEQRIAAIRLLTRALMHDTSERAEAARRANLVGMLAQLPPSDPRWVCIVEAADSLTSDTDASNSEKEAAQLTRVLDVVRLMNDLDRSKSPVMTSSPGAASLDSSGGAKSPTGGLDTGSVNQRTADALYLEFQLRRRVGLLMGMLGLVAVTYVLFTARTDLTLSAPRYDTRTALVSRVAQGRPFAETKDTEERPEMQPPAASASPAPADAGAPAVGGAQQAPGHPSAVVRTHAEGVPEGVFIAAVKAEEAFEESDFHRSLAQLIAHAMVALAMVYFAYSMLRAAERLVLPLQVLKQDKFDVNLFRVLLGVKPPVDAAGDAASEVSAKVADILRPLTEGAKAVGDKVKTAAGPLGGGDKQGS